MPLLPGGCRERRTSSVLFSAVKKAFKISFSMYVRDRMTLGIEAFKWIRLTVPQETEL